MLLSFDSLTRSARGKGLTTAIICLREKEANGEAGFTSEVLFL